MTPTVRLGRVRGVPIGAHWSVLIIVLVVANGLAVSILPAAAPGRPPLLYWTVGLSASLLFLMTLLGHELAHVRFAQRYGITVERVTLWGLGGVSEFKDEPPSPKTDLVVAVAGPLTSVVLAGCFLAAAWLAQLARVPVEYTAALLWLAIVNLALGVFNLLPGAPLDGGRVLRAALWWWHGDRHRAQAAAAQAGRFVGLLLITAGIVEVLFTDSLSGLWLALIGTFLIFAATSERNVGEARHRLSRIRVRDVMTTQVTAIPGMATVADAAEIVALSHQRLFPVIDLANQPSGVVTLATLASVPPDHRPFIRVSDVAAPLNSQTTVTPDTTLADVVTGGQGALGGAGQIVLEHGHVVGVLTPEDITRALELAALSRTPTTVRHSPNR